MVSLHVGGQFFDFGHHTAVWRQRLRFIQAALRWIALVLFVVDRRQRIERMGLPGLVIRIAGDLQRALNGPIPAPYCSDSVSATPRLISAKNRRPGLSSRSAISACRAKMSRGSLSPLVTA